MNIKIKKAGQKTGFFYSLLSSEERHLSFFASRRIFSIHSSAQCNTIPKQGHQKLNSSRVKPYFPAAGCF